MNGNGGLVQLQDVRLSAEQREQQRQQILHDMGVLARNLNLLRDGIAQYATATDEKIQQALGGVEVNRKHIIELGWKHGDLVTLVKDAGEMHHDFTHRTFWQRLRWLFTGR